MSGFVAGTQIQPPAPVPLAPQGTQPPVEPSLLDNPPRTRVAAAGPAPAQWIPLDPFAGLGFLDVLNVRAAMQARLESLSEDSDRNADNILATKRVLKIATDKLSPPAPASGMIALPLPQVPPTLTGTRPILPTVSPGK